MSSEILNLDKEMGADNDYVLDIVRKELSPFHLPLIVKKLMLSDINSPSSFSPVNRDSEVPWASLTEDWGHGKRTITAYPWGLSMIARDHGADKYLSPTRKDEYLFSGIMPVLDFNRMLGEIVSEDGRGLGPIDAKSVHDNLTETIAISQESADFSKIRVSFEFKFGQKGYEVIKVDVL